MGDSLLLGMGKDQAKAHLSQLDDPWDLPPYFLLRKNKYGKSLRTYSGYWKEKEEELTAIRSAGESSSSSLATASPSYVGVRKTLEFYLKDGTRGGEGTKTDWICHDYHHLRKADTGEALFLQEDVVLRKVFKKCKNKSDHASSLYRQVESCLQVYKKEKQVLSCRYNNGNKSDIVPGTEGLDLLPNIADNQDGSSSSSTPVHSAVKSSTYLRSSPYLVHRLSIAAIVLRIIAESWIESVEKLSTGTSEGSNEDLGVHCSPDGKIDKICNHFTKICSTNDPDEVYAACHRCDKVLKAHPKKHGTSHLRRHILTCSSCTNPSTDEDREMLGRLRTVLGNLNEQQKMDSQEDLTQLDPWDLKLTGPTPWYVTRSLNRQTQGGHWMEINKEFTAIRMDQQGCWKDIDKEIAVIQMDHQLHIQVPQYMGLRRTLQFHHQDARKVDWIMLEYQQLDDLESPALHLQGCMVIRKVFRYDKDVVGSAFSDLDRLLNADDGDEEYFNGDGVNADITTPTDCMDGRPCSVFPLAEGVSIDTTTPSSDSMDTPVDRKRKRTGATSSRKSEVWMHFTKIHNTDYGVVYVVCHTCDRGYTSGRSTNGTSHLRRHAKSCASKHRSTGNAKDAITEWETEIWPRLLPNLQELWRNRASGVCSS